MGKTLCGSSSRDAYKWDQSNCSLPIHENLTKRHFKLDSAGQDEEPPC